MPTVKSELGTDPVDRTLSITVTPVLVWNRVSPPDIGATISYAESDSTPNMPNIVNEQTGAINLSRMPANHNYTDNVDITLTLDTSQLRDSNGNPITGRWALASEGANGFCWFCTVNATPPPAYSTTPTTITGMSTSRSSDTVILINDDTADGGPSYAFCLGLVLPGFNNYYITIDPIISTKGTNSSFMLKS